MFVNDEKQNEISISASIDDNSCNCNYCGAMIAKIISESMVPSAEECYMRGNVPIPNFGWFCSQNCANKYEVEFKITFARTKEGKIDYYLC